MHCGVLRLHAWVQFVPMHDVDLGTLMIVVKVVYTRKKKEGLGTRLPNNIIVIQMLLCIMPLSLQSNHDVTGPI